MEEITRADYRVIVEMVSADSRVLDLGCGDGKLLDLLARHKNAAGQGLEIDSTNVSRCLQKGVSVIHGDLDEGLADYSDQSFGYVVLSRTLQVLKRPDLILDEVVRVGKTGIVSFPNFGHWRTRGQLLLKGRMPVTPTLPEPWYASPNIRLFTVKDFEDLCRKKNITIDSRVHIRKQRVLRNGFLYNLRADQAIFAVRKAN